MRTLRPILATDAPRFSALARAAYPHSYAHFWSDGGDCYAEKCFNEPQLLAEITDPRAEFFFVENDGQPIGFFKINWQKAPPASDLEPQNCAELERIYFLKTAVGQGAGSFAVRHFLEKCAEKKLALAWLRVMAESRKARLFYERFGFEKTGSAQLDFELLRPEMREILTYRLELDSF